MAQQMLLWRNDAAAVPLLEKMTADCQRPLARLHAFCTLDGLYALKADVVRARLAERTPAFAVMRSVSAKRVLPKSPELGDALLK